MEQQKDRQTDDNSQDPSSHRQGSKKIRNEDIQKHTRLNVKIFILSLIQPSNFYREMAPSRLISNFKNRKPETYKFSDKRYKIYQIYLNRNNKFEILKG